MDIKADDGHASVSNHPHQSPPAGSRLPQQHIGGSSIREKLRQHYRQNVSSHQSKSTKRDSMKDEGNTIPEEALPGIITNCKYCVKFFEMLSMKSCKGKKAEKLSAVLMQKIYEICQFFNIQS